MILPASPLFWEENGFARPRASWAQGEADWPVGSVDFVGAIQVRPQGRA